MQSSKEKDQQKYVCQLPEQRVKLLRNNFPFEPYDIQMKICQKIYSALDNNKTKFMIVESPTGTGKSYSLLVPVLSWLSQNKYKIKTKIQIKKSQNENKKLPAFLLKRQTNNESVQLKQINMRKQRQTNAASIVDIQQIVRAHKHKLKGQKLNYLKGQKLNLLKGQKLDLLKGQTKNTQQILKFDEVDIDQLENEKRKQKNPLKRQISKQQQFIQRQINMQKQDIPVKLIFVSRTHSQLQQIVKSAEQIKYKLLTSKQPLAELKYQQLLGLSLGSKELLCCNKQIKRMNEGQVESISQKCQYLLNNSSCAYSHSYKIRQFYGKTIEQAKVLSQGHKICGYYSLRNLIQCADILFVPYSSLVNNDIRTKIGININNSIIVFDQGHNLNDFIKASSSTQIFYHQLDSLIHKVTIYLDKYGEKMKIQNKNTLQHFIYVLKTTVKSMQSLYQDKLNKGHQSYIKLTSLQLILHLNIRQVKIHKIKNLFSLLDYDKKIFFFQPQPKIKTHNKSQFQRNISVTQIHKIINWFENLYRINSQQIIILVKSNNNEGKSFNNENKSINNLSFKHYCFYSDQLDKIIECSRLTIVAGGTMQPLSDFEQILNKIPNQIVKMGHIINPSQCRIHCINKYENKQIKFNHQNLSSDSSMNFLRKVIVNTLRNILKKTLLHEGVIVFIQSYKLLSNLKEALSSQQFYLNIVFDSQKQVSQNVNIFQIHSQRIKKKQRSILISVMGGRLSQGINFSDDLARKLIVFGLPYPNIKSPQIMEQMRYYDEIKLQNINGQAYYESLCLKTINQTIGRAIRHRDDWAQIYLIDKRFDGIKNKLSEWMKRSIEIVQNLEQL